MNTETTEHTAALAQAAATAIAARAPSQIITLDPAKYVAEVYQPFHDKLAVLKVEADAITPECSTTAGMEIAVKYRAAFRDDVRLAGERARVERKAPILQIGKLLDTKYTELKDAVAPYEAKFHDAIKAEEKRKEDLKAAEEKRKEQIRLRLVAIRELPLGAVGKTAAEITAMVTALEADEPDDSFGTLLEAAKSAHADALTKLATLHGTAVAAEAEAARIAVERAELAALREAAIERARLDQVEADRIASEQKKEADRLAALAAEQAAAALREREAAAAALKAEADAQAERNRAEQAELARQRQELLDLRAAAEARAAAEKKAAADRQHAINCYDEAVSDNAKFDYERRNRDHDEALAMDAEFNRAAAEAVERARAAEQQASAPAVQPPAVLMDADEHSADSDIEFLSSLADAKDMTLSDLLDRLVAIDFEAVRAELAAA